MMPVWAGALDEWNRMTGSITSLVSVGSGRLAGWHPAWASLSSLVWIDANREIQTGNMDRWGDQPNLHLITTAVSVDGQSHPYWRHNFDVLDGLMPVRPAQALYPNLTVGSDAPVQTRAFNDIVAQYAHAAADQSVGLVLDVNAVAGQFLESLESNLCGRLGWLAVAVPDPQLYESSFNLISLNQWADQNGFVVNRWASDGRSPVRWWIAAPNLSARALKCAHTRELDALKDLHARESAQLQRELRVLSRLVKTLSDQAQLAAVFREHNQTVIGELEVQLQAAIDWIETLQSRQFVMAGDSQAVTADRAPVAVSHSQASSSPSVDEQRRRNAENELLRAQAQINLLKDVMLGRIQ